jgi:hypothetical protein
MKSSIAVIFLTASMIISFPELLTAQCSDAGVCVIGSRDQMLQNHLSAAYVFGKSGKEDDLTFHTIEIEGTIQIFSGSSLVLLFPFSSISGPLGNTSGAGDLILLWDQEIWKETDKELSFRIGGKFATGASNSGNLPQAYQPGLGTNDLLAGISFETTNWIFAAGYQLSRGRSDNSITRLKRGDDLFAQAGYKTEFDILSAGIEILAIKRLHNSSVLDTMAAPEEHFVTIPESDQFQVNVLGRVSLPVGSSYSIDGMIAVPLNKREINVDGLTRSFTFSVGVSYTF